MNPFLTVIPVPQHSLKRASLEVLSRTVELAAEQGTTADVLLLGDQPDSFVSVASAHGADRVFVLSHTQLGQHLNTPLLKAITSAVELIRPSLITFASNESTKDILGALSAALGSPALPDVAGFWVQDDKVSVKRPVMAAKILANVTASLPKEVQGAPVLVSVRSGSYDVVEKAGRGETHSIDFTFDQNSLRQTLREVVKATAGTVDLAEADVIVAAGRGVKDDEGKRLISELASLFNAGIGASRALTESGVYDPSVQIGQTGKVVSPQLYFAVGISGAIQHVAGMSNSKVIVAINKDPDAPIFEVADYGLVGDLYQILPPLIDEIKALKG